MLTSQSEWARQKGFSRQYVSKLVNQGTLRLVDGKVDTEQAERALASIRNPAREPQRKAEPIPVAPVQIQPPPQKPPQPTAQSQSQPRQPTAQLQPQPSQQPRPPMFSKPAIPVDLPGGSSGDLPTMLLKARIKSEVKRASLLEIREKVETGKLVDANEVEQAAFNRARAVRAAWESWPNRVAGPLAAALGVEMRTTRIALEQFVREHLLEITGMEVENGR